MDKQVVLKPLYHRGQESIGIYFENSSLNGAVRKLPEVKWSQTNKCWYVPLNKELYFTICSKLKDAATIEAGELKKYLEKRKLVKATIIEKPAIIHSKPLPATQAWRLSHENLAALEKFVEQLKLKSYSPSTIRTYRNEFLQLLQLLKKRFVNDLTPDDLKRYMVYAMEKEGIKENTAHSRLNALKFYLPRWIKK